MEINQYRRIHIRIDTHLPLYGLVQCITHLEGQSGSLTVKDRLMQFPDLKNHLAAPLCDTNLDNYVPDDDSQRMGVAYVGPGIGNRKFRILL